jgi:hypothetical protein
MPAERDALPQRRQVGRQRLGGPLPAARSASSSAAGGRPASVPATPSATMLTQPPPAALAVFLSGSACSRAPWRTKTSGASPASLSPISRLPGPMRDLVAEAVEVLPVDGQQHVEAVVQRGHRGVAQAQQRGGLAAADLRTAGAHHQAVQAGTRRGVEQQRAGGHHAGAAAAGDGHREAAGGRRRQGT